MADAVSNRRSPSLLLGLSLWLLVPALSLGCSTSGGQKQALDGSSGHTGGGDTVADATLATAQAAGTIKVGFANEAPYAYLDPETQELTGEAPTIARAVLSDLGITEMEGVLVEFGALIPGLKAGRFDVIAAGMYITPARCEQVRFSEPTYCVGEAFLVSAGNPVALRSFEDVLANPEARLGVVSGTAEVRYAQNLGIPDSQLVKFPDMASAAAGVQAGRADAFAGTSLTVNDLLQKLGTGELERATPFTDPVIDGASVKGCGAFAFRPEDTALATAFDTFLAGYIGTDEHRAAVLPFGFTEGESTDSVSRALLCGDTSPRDTAQE